MTKAINHHSIAVTRTAHYSTFGELSKSTKYIWIVMHGYGQLAKRTIHKFDVLNPNEHFVVAVEGLNRFYWHKNNEPVACWMTKEDRYDEIEDFTSYLDKIHNRFCRHVNQEKTKIVLFGFSQGCATMWRWIHASKPVYHIAINWAGWIPEDISYQHLTQYLSDKEHHLWHGDEDKFLTDKSMADIKEVIQLNGLDINIREFKGEHKIPKSELSKFVKIVEGDTDQ